MQIIKISELKEHPQNTYYFDNMSGDKWQEFLKSVETSGVIEPIICNQNKVIISGHQRYRACKELGIEEVLCDIRHYNDEQQEIKDLIETNIRQRGDISSSSLKMGRIIKTLEECYGIKKGNNQHSEESDNVGKLTQKDIAEQLGMSVDTYGNTKKLLDLIPELQDLLTEGKLTTSTASRILARLSSEEQEEVLSTIGGEALSKMTQKQVQEEVNKIKNKENKELAKLREDLRKTEVRLVQADGQIESLKSKILLCQEKIAQKEVEYIENPDTKRELEKAKAELDNLRVDYDEMESLKQELSYTKSELRKMIGDSTKLDWSCKTSASYIKMRDFLKDMSEFDYLSQVFNEIPYETRKEWAMSVLGVFKWSKSILETIDIAMKEDIPSLDDSVLTMIHDTNFTIE